MSNLSVNWREWNEDSFREAREKNMPILLAISAVWCHWCHIMDKTSYSDKNVIYLINSNFIPIRVDNDKRPDINRRYNMGGWPTTAFLTPEGELITGATYVPPEQFKQMLVQINQFFNEKLIHETYKPKEEAEKIPGEIRESIVEEVVLSVIDNFDLLHGGFGSAPKFPHTDALELSLSYYHHYAQKGLLDIVTKTLDRMASREIYDREIGGFFRYSTKQDWSEPHYEKMCEDNAKLLANYLHAYQITGNKSYLKISEGILNYVDTTLANKDKGGFYGSQDADSEYYKMPFLERMKKDAPSVDKTIYTNWSTMMASSYFLASTVLNKKEYRDFALRTVNFLLEKLYEPNFGVSHFYTEGKSQMNGLLIDQTSMIHCLLDSYQLTGVINYLETAEKLADFIFLKLEDPKNGGFYDILEHPNAFGALNTRSKPIEENATAADALLKLYLFTGSEIYLEKAKKTLNLFAEEYRQYGIFASGYALSVDRHLNPILIVIVGASNEKRTKEFVEASLKVYDTRKLVEQIDPQTNPKRLKRRGYLAEKVAKAYICVGKMCLPPIEDPSEISQQISKIQKGLCLKN